jgi:ArsR family metal-binding transcriptional regulator
MAIPGAGASSLPIRMLAGAGQGAASSAAMFTPEGDSKVGQIAGGAIVGGAMPAVIQGAKSAGGAVMDKLRPNVSVTLNPQQASGLAGEITMKLSQKGIDFSKLTKDVQQSLLADAEKALRVGGSMDEAMLANKALIESVGAQPTRASLTRAPRDWQAEKNLRGVVGVGDDLVEREQTNATALTDYLGRLREKTGVKTVTTYEAGESAITAIKAQDAAKEKVVGNLYDAFRATGAQDAAVPDVKIADAMGRVADEIGVENIPGAVLSRLKEFGFVGGERTKLLTVNEADKLNRLINNNNPGHGPQSLALGRLKQSLNEALLDVPGDGSQALMTARAAAAQRFAEQKAGKGITAAIDDVSPDKFVKRFVLDADVRDVRAMKAELLKSAGGQQAVADIKGNILGDLMMKSTGSTLLEDVVGKPFSGVKFSKALDAIAPEKLHTIFTPDEIGSLRALQRASKLLTEEVPFSDVNHSKTAAALANLLQKIGNTPLLGGLVSPIIGTGKIGMDWVKNANDRKAVAEVLIGSAVQGSRKAALPAPGVAARVLPSGAAALSAEPSKRSNE